jgi:hypothetical protein
VRWLKIAGLLCLYLTMLPITVFTLGDAESAAPLIVGFIGLGIVAVWLKRSGRRLPFDWWLQLAGMVYLLALLMPIVMAALLGIRAGELFQFVGFGLVIWWASMNSHMPLDPSCKGFE